MPKPNRPAPSGSRRDGGTARRTASAAGDRPGAVKSAPTGSTKTGPTKADPPKGRPAKSGPAGGGAARSSRGGRGGGKSIVNQKQTPWALIVTTVVIVVFAVAIVAYAVTRGGGSKSSAKNDPNNLYTRGQLPATKAIAGLTYRTEANHTHVSQRVKYDASPPVGGNHSQYWADCTGTVYPKQLADENAVHALEHGAVWIAYRPGLPSSQIATLSRLVNGQNGTFMTPYAGLSSPISLQAWGYQLKVDQASDPRIRQFVTTLRLNPQTQPEPGATCSDPPFKQSPSTPDKPLF